VIGPGSQLAHYEVVSALGKGGMGEVWRAKDTKLGREVAIKTLPAEFAQDADRLARFEREAKLLASLNHPNIASIFGFEEDGGTHFLVMELVEGDTLADRVGRGAIPVGESLKLALQIAEALKAAHEKGVIHRDLKPANIKVTDDNSIKVLDFGLAKAFAGEEAEVNPSNSPTLSMQATQQGVILGTAAYMSPEQAKGRAVDKRADVWAFGCVLYEMLTGRQSFGKSDVTESLAAVISLPPEWDMLPGNLHPRLRESVERCLSKQAAERYQDIGDVRFDIQAVLSDAAGVIVESTAKDGPARPASKLPLMVSGIAAIVLAVISGVVAWTLKPADPRPVMRWSYDLGDIVRGDIRPMIAISPDGGQFAYVSDGELSVRRMDGLTGRVILDAQSQIFSPVFSPSGESVGYFDTLGGQIRRVGVGGGASVPIATLGVNPNGISWEPDGTILYPENDGIWRIQANGGEPERVIANGPDEGLFDPQLLPGGDRVLLSVIGTSQTLGDEADIVVASLTSGTREVILSGGVSPRYAPTGHLLYVNQGILYAVGFDLDRLETIGGAVPVIEGITQAPGRGAAFYDFSANGTLVYVPGTFGTEGGQLGWIDANGDREFLPLQPGQYSHPRLSPDGRFLAVERQDGDGADVWIYETSGESDIRLLTTEGGNNRYPVWTGDGEYVIFQSDLEGDGGLFWKRADGTGPVDRLTTPEADTVHVPESWSGAGNRLAYSSVRGSTVELWLWSMEDTSAERFGDMESNNPFNSAFSPDGEWLAYSQRDVGVATWVNSVSDPETKYQIGRNEDLIHHPLWSPDGSQLFYFEGADGALAVDVFTEPTLSFGLPVPLDDARLAVNVNINTGLNHDVAPDGRFLAVLTEGDDGSQPSAEAVVVQNWFEELKALVPVP
jgi:hypothetical protein